MPNKRYILRSFFVFSFLIFCLIAFSVKLVLLQIYRSEHLASLAEKQHNHLIEHEPIRGSIFDRYGRTLAVNVPVYSLYANPRQMTSSDKSEAVDQLSGILELPEEFLLQRLARKKYFIWLKRKLPMDQVEQVKALNLKGIGFIKESKRFYPNAHLASHIIGFAGIDNQGLEGIELSYDERLKGKPGWSLNLRDARQHELMIEKDFIPPVNGLDLVLTIDETIQFLAEQALEKAYVKHNAKSGTIIVMNVRTGEILALANRPTYDLGDVHKSDVEDRTNRAISFVYEPGSVFKIVTAAAALEEEAFVESDQIFCENGEYRVANHILHDHKPHGNLTFKNVFVKSSNIGVAKVAQKLGSQIIYKYGKRFRFGMPTKVDLKGEVAGYLKSPKYWSKTTIGAIPMGHEVTVTPLQLVSAIAAVANDGIYMRPFVVKYIKDKRGNLIQNFQPTVVDRVISVDTARRLKAILKEVVDSGTATRAKIEGISVGGKTGTAQKVIDGKYSHSKFYASFIGFAPVEQPLLAAVVVFDEPHPSYFGGTVSAPVFKEVIENALKYLNSKEPQQTAKN
ncbi:MAG: penicillin-binding protein [Candidatus Omnitrophica bacterium]|nr:penicillin-binding protein [Candidatus Omnitrophota bacterium]